MDNATLAVALSLMETIPDSSAEQAALAKAAAEAAAEAAADSAADAQAAAADAADAQEDAAAALAALGGVEIVADMTALAASTADRVLVLKDDSNWGTGGPCWFQKSATWTTYAYARSDGSNVYPVPDQGQLQPSSAPKEQLLNVLYTWIGNLALHHGETYNNDLFSTNCAKDSDDLFEMDCSAFVSAVLLGITYENSRYVLGENADNIELQYMSNHMGPSQSSYMPKGGLQASEIAMFFAQKKRLFTIPLDAKKARDTLQFGDILFNSNEVESPTSFYGIRHVRFVLGVSGEYVITAESTNSVGNHEQQNLQITYSPLTVGDSGTIGPNGYLRVFARPDYRRLLQTPAITPYKQGTYMYNAFFLPLAGIRRTTDSGDFAAIVPYGALYSDIRAMSTVDFLPVIPGSKLYYVGADTNSRGNYYNSIRCYEYDESYGLIKATSFAYFSNGSMVHTNLTLGSTTKFVRFMAAYSSNSSSAASDYIYLRDSKDMLIQITPPAAS